eukprot:m.319198 g.319198  ORF g.319198 m.319198 type:complete len:68 (+) comp20299_c0_seq1:1554-1757(+)
MSTAPQCRGLRVIQYAFKELNLNRCRIPLERTCVAVQFEYLSTLLPVHGSLCSNKSDVALENTISIV